MSKVKGNNFPNITYCINLSNKKQDNKKMRNGIKRKKKHYRMKKIQYRTRDYRNRKK